MAPPPPDEAHPLPDSIPRGDAQALERAFIAYVNPLSRYVYGYVRSWEVAEDLVQEVFYQLWRRLEERDAVQSVKAYVYTAARRQALDYLKHQRVEDRHAQQSAFALGAAGPAPIPEADQRLAEGEQVAAIQRAMDELPARQREVMLLRWKRQFGYAEIAAALSISQNTVEVHVRRALEHLRATLPGLLGDL